MTSDATRIEAQYVLPGMLVDLAGDPYADPQFPKMDEHTVSFEFEYQVVESVVRETDECVAISFEGWDTCGFPAQHRLMVVDSGT